MAPRLPFFIEAGREASCAPVEAPPFRGDRDSGLAPKMARTAPFAPEVPQRRSNVLARGEVDRAGPDRRLSPHPFALYRIRMPAFAHLLRICRGGNRPLRIVGGLVDDAGAALPMPAIGDVRPRFRPPRFATSFALVLAMALWTLARDALRSGRPKRRT